MDDVALKRGDVVQFTVGSDTGKPRLGVVVQSDLFNETHLSVVLCPVSFDSTGLTLFRIPIPADAATGVGKPAELMVDKLAAVRRDRIARRAGKLSRREMSRVDEALRRWLALDR